MTEKYECRECGQSIVVGVALTQPPTHKCPRHVNKVRPMDLVERRPSADK